MKQILTIEIPCDYADCPNVYSTSFTPCELKLDVGHFMELAARAAHSVGWMRNNKGHWLCGKHRLSWRVA